jgi:hypothetical protein
MDDDDQAGLSNAALQDEIAAVNAIYDFPVLEVLDGEFLAQSSASLL